MIGENAPRADAESKARGTLQYAADRSYPQLLHGAIVRSPCAHGRLRGIHKRPGVDWDQIVFATAADIPGDPQVRMISADMPFLAADELLYKGEPVALVAAATPELAAAARALVEVEVETLPALLSLDELVAAHQAGASELVTHSHWQLGHGEVDAAIASAEVIVERCYTTPHQEQAYLETNVMTAIPEPDGGMRVEGSLQCPYYVAPAVAAMLGWGLDRLHVLALPMGGAFGGKEDYPSQLGGHAALLAHLSAKPVRIVLERSEDIATTTKRHPSWIRIRAGAQRDGTLRGVRIEIVFDGGAYVTMSPVVLSRGAIHAAGPYRWPAVAIDARAYRTHTPPNGAFRGFGVPQAAFAIESLIDELALACGQSPYQLRLNNRLRPGDLSATSQRLDHTVASAEVLERALALSDFERKRHHGGSRTPLKADAAGNDRAIARGVGLAFFWHGAGFTGAGEAKIAARVALDLAADGKAHIRVSSTEMGQGAHTVLAQIVAHQLGVATRSVVVDPVDTRYVPNSGPTVASRTTMIVGGELASCATAAKAALLERLAASRRLPLETLSLGDGVFCGPEGEIGSFEALLPELLALGHAALAPKAEPDHATPAEARWTFESQHQLAPHIKWDEARHFGDAYATYGWGACVAEIAVDRATYELSVEHLTMVVDVGRAVNPTSALGQIEGGCLQALGYGLSEEVGLRPDGSLLRDRFQSYILPTALDAPPWTIELLEVPYERGPGGAKGLGEMPMNGAAPAVANALADALGVRVRELPVTPEKILAALEAAEELAS